MACWNCGAVPVDLDELSATSVLPPIDHKHLLETNDSPNDAEIPVVQDCITSGRRRVDAVNAQIDLLRAKLDQLVAERDVISEHVQQYTAVLSPIRRVPPELICEVFAWTLPCIRRVAGEAVNQPPWYLGHISRPWRDIALAYPTLWSSITVPYSRLYPHQSTPTLASVETQLLRSANAPLVVDFTWFHGFDAIPFLNVLLKHSDRWASTRFACDANSRILLLDLLQPIKGRLSQLNKLEFIYNGADSSAVSSDVFSIAPNLREVLFAESSYNQYSSPLLLPWEKVTRYRGILNVQQQLEALRVAPNLIECGLGFQEWGAPFDDASITLPHLRQLYVERGEFLAYLTAPKLEYLSCDTVDSMLSFVHRSSCQLTTLVLTERTDDEGIVFTLSPDTVIPLLRSTPSLRNFVLQANRASLENDRIMSAMTLSGSSDDLCPNLISVAYGSMDDELEPFSADYFVPMIQSRLHLDRSCRLSSLRLFCDLHKDDLPQLIERMQPLMDEGLDVSLVRGEEGYKLINEARHSFVLPF
ncbi:hypothetical protein B0H13DRAFT_1716751 [Mycena leptocephala]|nr:hypothetical protein B0H13DRAFT_1716751 [Mycena leptocephala]